MTVTDLYGIKKEVGLPASPNAAFGFFGDGSDGVANFNGTLTPAGSSAPSGSAYTLLRSVFYSSVTVTTGISVRTAGYKMFCSGVLKNSGKIHNDGNSTTVISGAAGLAAAELGGSFAGANGGTGAAAGGTNGNAGVVPTVSAPLMGGKGGDGGVGGAAGTFSGGPLSSAASITNALKPFRALSPHLIAGVQLIAGGGGGGAGGSGATATGSTNSGGPGGGGGGGGGVVLIFASVIDNSAGTISAVGGTGAVSGTAWTGAGAAGSGGGGGGGGGGVIFLAYNCIIGAAVSATGGSGGSTQPGFGAGGAGATGQAGAAGTVLKYNMLTGAWE